MIIGLLNWKFLEHAWPSKAWHYIFFLSSEGEKDCLLFYQTPCVEANWRTEYKSTLHSNFEGATIGRWKNFVFFVIRGIDKLLAYFRVRNKLVAAINSKLIFRDFGFFVILILYSETWQERKTLLHHLQHAWLVNYCIWLKGWLSVNIFHNWCLTLICQWPIGSSSIIALGRLVESWISGSWTCQL